jgi:hypothetical protein
MPERSKPGVVFQGTCGAFACDDKRSDGAFDPMCNELVLPKSSSGSAMPSFSRGAKRAIVSVDRGRDVSLEVDEHRFLDFTINRTINDCLHRGRPGPGVVTHDVVPGPVVDRGIGPIGEAMCVRTKPNEVGREPGSKLCAAVVRSEKRL